MSKKFKILVNLLRKGRETYRNRPVRLLPTKSIKRAPEEYSYTFQRQSDEWSMGDTDGTHKDVVNSLRKSVRNRTKEIPPIEVYKLRKPEGRFRYGLYNGHHRLTAHQAEGKKGIKALIYRLNDKNEVE